MSDADGNELRWRDLSLELRGIAGSVVALIDALPEDDAHLRGLGRAADRLVGFVDRMESMLGDVPRRDRSPVGGSCCLVDLLGPEAACEFCGQGPRPAAGDPEAVRAALHGLLAPPEDPPTVAPTSGTVSCGDIAVDLDAHVVVVDGRSLRLPLSLMRLLAALAANAGRMLTTEELEMCAWNASHANGYLHTAIHRLRRALSEELGARSGIETVRAMGYRLEQRVPDLPLDERRPTPAGRADRASNG